RWSARRIHIPRGVAVTGGAPGHRRLPRRRNEHRFRAGGPARARHRACCRRTGAHGGLPGVAAVVHRDVGVLRVPAPQAAARAVREDPRGVLLLSLGIIAVCALPCLLIFLVGAHTLLAIAFSPKRATASSSLLPLGAAFTVLAATYLAVQYMLALKRTWFLLAIGAVAVLEPILLLHASHHPAGFAGVVLGVQALGALVALALALG